MATYVPNALDPSQPTGDKKVSTAAPEFRGIKTLLDTVYAAQTNFQVQLDALQAAIGAGDNSVALAANLGLSTDGAKGSGLVGAGYEQNYVVRTIGAVTFDGLVNIMWLLSAAEKADVKALTYTLDITAKLTAAKVWAGNRLVYLPKGGYSFNSFDLKGWYGGLWGDGLGNTILKVRGAVAQALDVNEVVDVIYSPLLLSGFTLDCNNLANIGINTRFRHHTLYTNLLILNPLVNGLKEKDTWLNTRHEVRVSGGVDGMWLVGSNHNSRYVDSGVTNCTGNHLKIERAGTAADGNDALKFTRFEIEFGGAGGVGAYIDATSVLLDSCYIGENISGAIFNLVSGIVTMIGGVAFAGNTAISFLVTGSGGKIIFIGVKGNMQTFTGQNMLHNTTGAKYKIIDSDFSFSTGGSPTSVGDALDYGPASITFARALGKEFTGTQNNATNVTALVGLNGRSMTCTAAPGPSPIIGLQCNLTLPSGWVDGEPLYLVLVYSSNKVAQVRLSGASFGGAPTVNVSNPASSGGVVWTHAKLDSVASSAAYLILEILINPSAVTDTFSLFKAKLADSRMLNKMTGQLGNHYL